MNRKHKILMTCALMLTLLFAFTMTVSATGTGSTSIAVSKSSMNVGDSLTVTIQAPAKDTFTVSFNGSVLSLTNCSASVYTTSGSTVSYTGQNATLTFSAAAAGTSYISVKPNTLTGSSTNVTVAAPAESTSTETTTETTQDTTSTEADNTVEGDFEVDGIAYVVSERFSDDEIPAGFEKTELTINNSKYKELSNGSMTLVYLKPASDTSSSGKFYIYSEESNSVSLLSMLGSKDDYVIIQTPDSLPSELFTEAQFSASDMDYYGYALSGYEDDGFYFVYGVDENQNTGWFQYNTADGTVQTLNTDMLSMISSHTDEGDGSDLTASSILTRFKNSRSAIAILIFVVVVLAIITINFKVLKSKNDDDVFDDENDFDEVDEKEPDNKVIEKKSEFSEEVPEEVAETVEISDDEDSEENGEEEESASEKEGFFSRLFHRDEDIFEDDDTTGTIFDEDMSISNAVNEDKKSDKKNDKDNRRSNGDLDVMDLNDL